MSSDSESSSSEEEENDFDTKLKNLDDDIQVLDEVIKDDAEKRLNTIEGRMKEEREKIDSLTNDVHTMFETTNNYGVRLDNIEETLQRLDNIEISLQAINHVLIEGRGNIGINNGPGAGGGKRRKKTRKRRRRTRRKR